MIKIKITCNWSSSEEVIRRLITQFQNIENNRTDIEFVTGGEYDINVVYGYITDDLNNKPTLLFPQEPYWSGNHQKSFNGIDRIKVFGFDKNNYSPINCVHESIAYMFYGGRGPWEEGFDNWNYSNLTSNNFIKDKDFCSFLSNRGLEESSYPNNCLYGQRISIVKNLSSILSFIDFYGWGDSNNLKPFARQKYSAIKDYKFCLTIENSHEKNYISEKFYDCILTNTIPIYYGCSNIRDYWPEDGFFLLESIDDHKYLTKTLNWIYENRNKLYREMLPKIQKMKTKYFNDFNLINKIITEISLIS